jgi:hypothetical protein
VFVTEAECAAQGGTFKGAGVTCESGFCNPPGEQFSVILIPDTQHYTNSDGANAYFRAMMQWAVNNRVSYNIVAVSHEGDISDDDTPEEYRRADGVMTLVEDPLTTGLPDGIPYAMLRGNHDGTSANFNQFFGVSRYSGRGYYGGHYGTTNDNSYVLFSGGGRDFILVALSYAPSSDVLTWAHGVIASYPNRLAIVTSHSILNVGGTQTSWTSEGTAIYNALRDLPNLRLMACGHNHGEGRRTDVYNGNTVHSMLADYQDDPNGGNGYLRLLQFMPATNRVLVRTYSPYLNQYMVDADSSSQFTLTVELGGGTPQPQALQAPPALLADFPLLGTVAGVPSGSTASLIWSGLDLLTQYEWYVKVGDRHTGPVTGPTWDFTTLDISTPTLLSRFTASAVGSGIELRWEFSEPGRFSAVTVERAGRAEGPWTGVAVEQREENGVNIALDRSARSGSTYWYRIAATVGSTRLTFGPIEATAGEVIHDFTLSWPLPNPTSGATRLDFAVPHDSRVSLGLYDMQGRRVATLVEGSLRAGRHQAVWNGKTGDHSAPTGIYFLRLKAEGVDISRRLVVTR